MINFWTQLTKPFTVLAPMADVTDAAFRSMIAQYSRPAGPEVFYTEFLSFDGLFKRPLMTERSVFTDRVYTRYGSLFKSAGEHGVASDNPLLLNLLYGETERPIVAQVFTADPELMERGATLIRDLGFDGLDINMGCPDRSIEKQGCGAALIRDPRSARRLIKAARAGAGPMPVSVKTRAGYNRDEVESWIPQLLKEEPSALILHARTRKEMSKVPADWRRVKGAVALRDKLESPTLIVGNGDAIDPVMGKNLASTAGADGVMIGRGVFGRPWLWASKEPGLEERLRIMISHTRLYEELFAGHRNFAIMKKHYKAYVSGWSGAKELRAELMAADNSRQVEEIVESFLNIETSSLLK